MSCTGYGTGTSLRRPGRAAVTEKLCWWCPRGLGMPPVDRLHTLLVVPHFSWMNTPQTRHNKAVPALPFAMEVASSRVLHTPPQCGQPRRMLRHRATVSLNNTAVSLLQHGLCVEAMSILRDAPDLVRRRAGDDAALVSAATQRAQAAVQRSKSKPTSTPPQQRDRPVMVPPVCTPSP